MTTSVPFCNQTSGVQCERCHMPESWRHLSGEAAAKKVKS